MSMPRKWPNGYYCYTLSYPDGTPYYVGIGKGSRGSLRSYRNPWAQHIRDKIIAEGGEVRVNLEEFVSREEAAAREVELIAQHGRRDIGTGILANLTAGGEGSVDRVRTSEERERIAAAQRGRRQSAEQRAAISARLKGNKHLLGHRHSEETKRKISLAGKGKKLNLSDEERKRRSEAMRARIAADPSICTHSIGSRKKVRHVGS